MQADNAPSVERQKSYNRRYNAPSVERQKSYNRRYYRSLPLNLFMAENNSESVDVDPHPHSNTDTPGTVTCLPVAAVECLKLKR